MKDWENCDIFAPLFPSTSKELEELREEALKEARKLLKKDRTKAMKFLEILVSDLDIRKLLSDMYVWQRVATIKAGVDEALAELFAVRSCAHG